MKSKLNEADWCYLVRLTEYEVDYWKNELDRLKTCLKVFTGKEKRKEITEAKNECKKDYDKALKLLNKLKNQ